jgi:hypothetical protein
MCSATIWNLPGGLRCVETGEHATHRFEASACGDGHDASEAAAEAGRG